MELLVGRDWGTREKPLSTDITFTLYRVNILVDRWESNLQLDCEERCKSNYTI
jgi:hypothetical protein